jgi:hypothetical protein
LPYTCGLWEQLYFYPPREFGDEGRRRSDMPQSGKPIWAATVVPRVLGASLVTLGVLAVMLLTSKTEVSRVDTAGSATARPNSTPALAHPIVERKPAPAAPKPAPAPAAAKPPAPMTMDDRGFSGSKARCERPQSAVAIGRTKRSLVVVCKSPNGSYEYKGVRLSDGAALSVRDVRVTAGKFEARTDGAVYAVSSKELVVTLGDATLARDAMVEYRDTRR